MTNGFIVPLLRKNDDRVLLRVMRPIKLIHLPQPRSAWLLMGDEASFESARKNSLGAGGGDSWTCSPHIEIGDTLLLYFRAPRKAVHFVARAVSRPYKDESLSVMSQRPVDPHQWWVNYGFVVEVEPIAYSAVKLAAGEPLMLKGRSGKLLRNETANKLLRGARIVSRTEVVDFKSVLARVQRRIALPDPRRMTLLRLKQLPSSAFRLEADVEQYFVEPLLRMLGSKARPFEYRRRFFIGRKIADYVVLRGKAPCCVIEVKLRAHLDKRRNWALSPDVQQAAAYAKKLNVPYVLIDCEEVFCFSPGSLVPTYVLERKVLVQRSLSILKRHLCSAISCGSA